MLFASLAIFFVPNEKTSPPTATETVFSYNVSETATVIVPQHQHFELSFFETGSSINNDESFATETAIAVLNRLNLPEKQFFEQNLIANSQNFTNNRFIKDNRTIYSDKRLFKLRNKSINNKLSNKSINNKLNSQFTQKITGYLNWYSKSSNCSCFDEFSMNKTDDYFS